MRFLHVFEKLVRRKRIGGLVTHNLNLLKSLRRLGHEIEEFCPQETATADSLRRRHGLYQNLQEILPNKLVLILKELYSLNYDRQFKKMLEMKIREVMPDILFERYTNFHQAASLVAKELNIPYILEFHAPATEQKWFKGIELHSLAARIEIRVLQRADAIIVVAEPVIDYMKQKGIEGSKIHYIPNAVDPEMFKTHGNKSIREQMQLDGKVVIGFVGSMKHYHGLGLLMKAAKIVCAQKPEAHFLLLGPTENHELLERQLRDGELHGSVVAIGSVPYEEVPSYIESTDICVISNALPHGTPIKLFEYGAMGKAVALPDMPHLRSITTATGGAFFEPGNPDSLAKTLISLIEDESYRRFIGNNLQSIVLKQHTWELNAKKIVAIGQSLLETGVRKT